MTARLLKNCADYCVYFLVRVLICVVQAMRIETCQKLSRIVAWLAADILRIRRQVVDDNLQHAFPHLSADARRVLIRRHWEHLLLMGIEIAHAPRKIHLANWSRHIHFHGKREIVRRLIDERPAVIVSGHFGNFEIAGQVVGLLGFPSFTVARPLDNRYLNRFVNRFRGRGGQLILEKRGSGDEVSARLSRGETLAVLSDQAAGPKGCWVDFFGRPASTHKAIALFALTHDAPLMVICGARRDRPLDFDIRLEGVADPQQGHEMCRGIRPLTGWFSARLEDAVRRRPEQYWWVHRRWKTYDRQPRPSRRRAA